MSNASSAAATVEKLDAWMAYALSEPRVIGFVSDVFVVFATLFCDEPGDLRR